MTDPNPSVVAGIDVGKSKLDTHILDRALDRQFNNDTSGRRALRNWLRKHGVTRAVFEPTGRYHRNLHQCLARGRSGNRPDQPLALPALRNESIGQLAKNDRVDAAMLARFGLLDNLAASPPQARNLQLLSDLLVLRGKLVEQLAALRKLCAELDPQAAACPAAALKALQTDIAGCDRPCATASRPMPPSPGERHHPVDPRLRPIQRRLPVCRHARTRLPRPPPSRLAVGPRPLRPRLRPAPRQAQHLRWARPTPAPALHGSSGGHPLGAIRQSLLRTPAGPRQAPQGRSGRRHAPTGRPARHPSPRRPPLAAPAASQRTGGCCMKPLPTSHRPTADTTSKTGLLSRWPPLFPANPLDAKHGSCFDVLHPIA